MKSSAKMEAAAGNPVRPGNKQVVGEVERPGPRQIATWPEQSRAPGRPMARKKLFEKVLGNESQRVLNLMRHVVDEMKKRPENKSLVPLFEPLVAVDPTTENGLSPMATAALRLSEMALVGQMLDDYTKGKLDLDRMEMLIGGGAGAAIVGQAMADPIMRSLPQ
jgi:hypothetical protein